MPTSRKGKKRQWDEEIKEPLAAAEKIAREEKEKARAAEERARAAEERARAAEERARAAEEAREESKYKAPVEVCAYYSSGSHTKLPVTRGRLANACGLYNLSSAEQSVMEAAATIGRDLLLPDVRSPLPTVIAASGQGKTEFLKHLYLDQTMHPGVIAAFNSNRPPPATRATTILPLYATFNDSVGYSADEGAVGALINRIAASYYGVLPHPNVSRRCEAISLLDLLCHIVSLEEKKWNRRGILALVLVDEIMTLKVKKSPKAMSSLLNEVCRTMDPPSQSFLYLPIVSSLQVDGLFSQVTTHSKRPLSGIPLFPCRPEDLPDMADKVAKHMKKGEKSHKERLRLARLYGGHYRTLEATLVKQDTPTFSMTNSDAKRLLGVLKHILLYPDKYVEEEMVIEGKTIWDIVSKNICGVFYRDVNVNMNAVRLAVTPIAMLQFANESTDDGEGWITLFSELASTLIPAQTKEGFAKAWELAVPIGEALYMGLTGRKPPYMEGIPNLCVRRASRDYYATEVRYPDGGLAECAWQLEQDLTEKNKVISYPLIDNLRGIEGGHTLYGVPCVFQCKLWKKMTAGELKEFVLKVQSVIAGTDIIGVLYVTGATQQAINDANEKYNCENIYVIDGNVVLSILQPLIGTFDPADNEPE